LATWDARIEEQKGVYKAAVEECRKEEALIEEMGAKLEELRAAVNIDQHSQANSPQYEMALEAIESLSKADFNELKSFRLGLELRNGLGGFVKALEFVFSRARLGLSRFGLSFIFNRAFAHVRFSIDSPLRVVRVISEKKAENKYRFIINFFFEFYKIK
jgi:hypothetical protein